MSAQTRASEHWDFSQRMARIEDLRQVAMDYSYPAGQAQVGIQLATVEIPFLMGYIEYLKGQINDRDQAAA